MKCFVLAGGSGDALWPLSRKNYPKQFININESRSLFQEAIARNLPFCDEFYIITNEKYRYIVEGQLQAFQGLHYRCFLEQIGRQTAPAIAIATLCVEPEEEIIVVSTDHVIGGGDYNATILSAKNMLENDHIVAVGAPVTSSHTGHGYFSYRQDNVLDFYEHVTKEQAESFYKESGFLWDSGIFLMHARTYLEKLKHNVPNLYEMCVGGKYNLKMEKTDIVIPKEWMQNMPSVSFGKAVCENIVNIKIVKAQFAWSRLLDLETLAEYTKEGAVKNVISHACKNVDILNETENDTIVTNGLEDVLVVHTKDATYISKKNKSADIKTIIETHYNEKENVFDEGDVFYTTWGIKETLNRAQGYMVKKLTIFPGKSIAMHKHTKRSEHWSIVSGTAFISMNEKKREYHRNESIYVPINTFHQIANETARDLIVIEVSIGESAGLVNGDMVAAQEDIIKLLPAYKDYLWGGRRLQSVFRKSSGYDMVAESWELSTHHAGESIVAEGPYKGMQFGHYVNMIGKQSLGWKCQPFEMFPLLIKFLDAAKPLSIQVHPDDAYALPVEGEYGKNEMWYVIDCEPDAYIYCGFSQDMTKQDVIDGIENKTIVQKLQKVPIQKGDTIFVEAGMVHALAEGTLILEIQQSSNATYRLYDYGRIDKDGKPRQLHIQKALDNLQLCHKEIVTKPEGEAEQYKGYKKQLLGECKYFSCICYTLDQEADISLDDSSFSSLIFLEGSGHIWTENVSLKFRAGDSFFIPAGKKAVKVKGKAKFILTHI